MGARRRPASERERALRQSEARTRLVLDSAPDAFVTLDRDGIIITWNAAAERHVRLDRRRGDRQADARA